MFQGMEYVYEVYKERSFSKAAANLFISQPSLSANVKRIEKKIGYPIFDRSTKPLGLTECGQHYIDAVEHIMQVENGFHDFVNDWSNLKTGQLILGGSSFFSSWVLPPLIGEFSRKYPLVKPLLLEENTATLAQYLWRFALSGRTSYGCSRSCNRNGHGTGTKRCVCSHSADEKETAICHHKKAFSL